MKKVIFFIFIILGSSFSAKAQNDAAATEQKTTSGLAKSLGLYVFPSKGQDQKTQDADEYACYKWAIEQTGVDPMNPPKVEAQKVQTGPDGSGIRGAAGAAAAGAAIGAITGDAGEGAAVGAVVGAMRGRRSRKVKESVAQQQTNQQAAAQTQALMDNFKKAFSVCMEGKGYTVK